MNIWYILLSVAGLGAIGGLTNAINSGEVHLPRIDKKNGTWRPGWIGNVVTGAVAAAVVWGLYGPMGSFDIPTGTVQEIHFSIVQLLNSVVVGFAGGRYLTLIAQNGSLKVENEALATQMNSIEIVGTKKR